ncbi:UPAR/Ly6 domain-containing protein bou-like [Babylonia areolata]|uniref:UPAR/Ly6 domain-containing protein bou-like n=1 Tax=Babylonia areolata TaxID=304850 RepID=UPI003FD03C3C
MTEAQVCRSVCLLVLLVTGLENVLVGHVGVEAIDCYKCTSINGANQACEDPFKQDLSTVDFIARNCQYGYFGSTHCIKLKGVKEDGTRILVRHCSNSDWGKNCGDIRYSESSESDDEEDEERIQGCLTTCNFDGCNSAPARPAPSPLLLAGVGVGALAVLHLTVLRVF